jgi:hypothetical protein
MFFLWNKTWQKRAGKLMIKLYAVAFFVAIACWIAYALNGIPIGGF